MSKMIKKAVRIPKYAKLTFLSSLEVCISVFIASIIVSAIIVIKNECKQDSIENVAVVVSQS